jgi:hypothetical protein
MSAGQLNNSGDGASGFYKEQHCQPASSTACSLASYRETLIINAALYLHAFTRVHGLAHDNGSVTCSNSSGRLSQRKDSSASAMEKDFMDRYLLDTQARRKTKVLADSLGKTLRAGEAIHKQTAGDRFLIP